jgi:DNA-binding LytR/AlgR family response regulator
MTETCIRALIVDDEPVARQRLRRLLGEMDGVQSIGECKNGREAVARILEDRPDLVLLDVRMPTMDGFEVLRQVGPESLPIVVFVTAFDEHATAAFDVHALDYVVKPVEPARLKTAVERARKQLANGEHGPTPRTASGSPTRTLGGCVAQRECSIGRRKTAAASADQRRRPPLFRRRIRRRLDRGVRELRATACRRQSALAPSDHDTRGVVARPRRSSGGSIGRAS